MRITSSVAASASPPIHSLQVYTRPAADADVDGARVWLRDEAGHDPALEFLEGLQTVFALLAEFPGAGSPRPGVDLGIPALRCMPISDQPYLVFYIMRESFVDVVRILHSRHNSVDLILGDYSV